MNSNDFCVFILTHGRPDNVITYNTLLRQGYTGKIYLIVDDEDKQLKSYKEKFKDRVVVFSKKEISEKFDLGDNFDNDKVIVYARNACFDIAESLKIKYFIQLDDDYMEFSYRTDEDSCYIQRNITNLDNIFLFLLNFYKKINCLSLAISQSGDFIGGKNNKDATIGVKRKCMNSFICSTERKFSFFGKINEDVNTYTSFGRRGFLFFTVMFISLTQKQTQENSAGMTDIYLEQGTYIKSFYSVMYSPSCVKISTMGEKHKRLHHRVLWNNTAVKIISERHKK